VPWVNDQPRARKPPLVVWLNMLVWTGLDANRDTPSIMILRARLVAASLALVMIASTFWIGCVLRDRQLGLIAAAVLGTMVLFQVQGRMASYDIHVCAWSTLAVAAALWAMLPFSSEKAPWLRFAFGWLLASLALG